MPCGRLGPTEIVIIVLVIAMLFGVNRLPKMGENLGKGMMSFKRALEGPKPRKRSAGRRKGDRNNGTRSNGEG